MHTLQYRPQYNVILRPVVLLAPLLDMKALNESLLIRAAMPENADEIAAEYLANPGPIAKFNRTEAIEKYRSCLEPINNVFCLAFRRWPFRFDPYTCVARVAVYGISMQHATTCRWTMVHNYQCLIARRFQTFDYGSEELNMQKYSSPVPIPWTFASVSSQFIALIYSRDDEVAVRENVKNFLKNYPNVKPVFENEIHSAFFRHSNFVVGASAGLLVNSDVLKLLAKYAQNK